MLDGFCDLVLGALHWEWFKARKRFLFSTSVKRGFLLDCVFKETVVVAEVLVLCKLEVTGGYGGY